MSKHTSGQWSVSEINASGEVDRNYIFIEPNVAVVERKVAGRDQHDMADAALIAAAPAMYEALQFALQCMEAQVIRNKRDPLDDIECNVVRAAIAKAGGAS